MHGHRIGAQHLGHRNPLVTTADAQRPSSRLPGLDPRWSRHVTTPDADGIPRTWHVLDNGVADPVGTLLCVHGNPTWSYLWRRLLADSPPGWRVVAVDQLDMGYSERTGALRRLATRVADLVAFSDGYLPDGPVVSVGHDWGGAISLGWALANTDRLRGVVLTNTAVHQPAGSPAPGLIRLVRSGALREAVCVRSTAFLRGALAMSHDMDAATRAAFLAPYGGPGRRAAIGEFVADIPLEPDHPSAAALDRIAAGLDELHDVPTLLLWGPDDPVFSDLYLEDLRARLPRADVHRFEGAGHLLPEDGDIAGAVSEWLTADGTGRAIEPTARRPLWSGIDEAAPDAPAVAEMNADGAERQIRFGELAHDVRSVAAGLRAHGLRPGDRVALLVPPGIDLITLVYGCWRAGASVVIADAGLGARGMSRALRAARPRFLVGIPKALAAARALRWPGARILCGRVGPGTRRALGITVDLNQIRHDGEASSAPTQGLGDSAEAAVLFTSGATGPAKGVVYRHDQLAAQRDAIAATYGITADDRLVAAFAPFALAAPALGITSVVPAMDVTKPATLDAAALADAVAAIDATLIFASPAALANSIDTAGTLDDRQREALGGVRILMSAGAPISADLLRSAETLLPAATAHTPYGMTEVLPVADITLSEIDAAGPGEGVCVGHPIAGVEVAVLPLDATGVPGTEPIVEPDVTGEVCVRAPHGKDRYDGLWLTEHRSRLADGAHRAGDVGHLDREGRLWIEGRLVHVISTAEGPVTPVGLERRVEQVSEVERAAAVGVGPRGVQQVVVVVTGPPVGRRGDLASLGLTDAVRKAAGRDVAAVLVVPDLPVDIRHNSKIDRARLARYADAVLAGGRPRP